MTTSLKPVALARASARVSPVAVAFGKRAGLTPGSAHQHIQRIRRDLLTLIIAANDADRAQWLDWFFVEIDQARLTLPRVSGSMSVVLVKGTVDRNEDRSREAYLFEQSDENARDLDARLEREQLCIAETRAYLRQKHARVFQ